jgi:hypothetical protein
MNVALVLFCISYGRLLLLILQLEIAAVACSHSVKLNPVKKYPRSSIQALLRLILELVAVYAGYGCLRLYLLICTAGFWFDTTETSYSASCCTFPSFVLLLLS